MGTLVVTQEFLDEHPELAANGCKVGETLGFEDEEDGDTEEQSFDGDTNPPGTKPPIPPKN